MKRALWGFALLVICLVAMAARCANLRQVFFDGQIYFADADCYSRMTRAAHIVEGRGWVIRHHDFENWPAGITPHTTAPMDWLIVTGSWVAEGIVRVLDSAGTSVLRDQTLDVSGALLSPLLGIVTCLFLGIWARRFAPAGTSLAAPLLFAVSPILVHGTALGRPDHQSLLLLLLAVALAAELTLVKEINRAWGIVAGAAWALALWVSLYEPAVLLGLVLALWLGGHRRRFAAREMRAGWIVFGTVLLVALALEHWRLAWPDATLRKYFETWQTTIGELVHVDPRGPALYTWLSLALLPAPVLLFFVGKSDRRAWAIGGLLVAVLCLTIWQARWGYFLALVFALSLPWVLAFFQRRWIAWGLFVVALWPVARDWDVRLSPSFAQEKQAALQRLEMSTLRRYAVAMRSTERAPFLAPWWLSPALVYWSGQPGVAGSSHQSLPGIVDTAQFFLTEQPPEAAAILKARRVAWVVADEATRVIGTSAALLAQEPPSTPLALVLAEFPHNAPPFLREVPLPSANAIPGVEVSAPTFYRLYHVDKAKLPP